MGGERYGFRSKLMRALQLEDKGPNQQQEGDKTRHRVARQADEMAGANLAVSKGLAGLDGDLPERQFAQRLHGRLDMVFFADRHTATGEYQVVLLGGTAQRLDGGLALVG